MKSPTIVQMIINFPTDHEQRLKNIMEGHDYKFISRYIRSVQGGRSGSGMKLFMNFKYEEDTG